MNRIAVIGIVGTSVSMKVDAFHTGGETVPASDIHIEYGGKGFNQAIAAARQGMRVSFLAAIGEADVPPVRSLMADEGIDFHAAVAPGVSAYAVILTDGTGANQVTVYTGPSLAPADVDAFAADIEAADILLINNEVPEEVNLRATEIATRCGVRTILNPAPARPLPETLRRRISIFTPNEFETEGIDADAETVVTLGAAGCLIRRTGLRLPAPNFGPAIDTTGAGDTFSGVLAACLARGLPLEEAAAEANAAAARSVTVRYVFPAIPKAPNPRP